MGEEFYKNSSWSKPEKDFFYSHLRNLADDKKSYFLNEKAELLLNTRRKNALKGVLTLTDDAIFGYPDKREICRSYTLRARAYELLRNVKKAEECYRQAYIWAGMSTGDKLDVASNLVTFILRHRRKGSYDEALDLAAEIERDIFRRISHDFVALAAKAIIAKSRGKRLRQSANEALKLVQIRKPAIGGKKKDLVDLDYHGFMIDELLKIVK